MSLRMILVVLIGLVAYAAFAGAEEPDPRLAIDDVQLCVTATKDLLSSTEYNTRDKEDQIIGACRDADPDCVRAVGEGLQSSERSKMDQMLPLVRACHGRNIGKCYRAITANRATLEYQAGAQALALLKKCE